MWLEGRFLDTDVDGEKNYVSIRHGALTRVATFSHWPGIGFTLYGCLDGGEKEVLGHDFVQ